MCVRAHVRGCDREARFRRLSTGWAMRHSEFDIVPHRPSARSPAPQNACTHALMRCRL
jgi:hypothetical protein